MLSVSCPSFGPVGEAGDEQQCACSHSSAECLASTLPRTHRRCGPTVLTCHSARQQQARCRVFRACRACAEAHTAGRGGGGRLCMEGVEGGARTRPNRARHGFAVPWGGAVRVSSKPLSTKMARGRGPDRTVGAQIHTAVRALACPATRALPLAGFTPLCVLWRVLRRVRSHSPDTPAGSDLQPPAGPRLRTSSMSRVGRDA